MSDLINRSTLLQEVKSLTVTVMGLRAGKGVLHEYAKQYRDTLLRVIDEQPTIEAVPVVYGCNNNQNYHEVDEFRCSVCGLHLEDWERHVHDGGAEFIREYVFKYCPECGAMMKGGAE